MCVAATIHPRCSSAIHLAYPPHGSTAAHPPPPLVPEVREHRDESLGGDGLQGGLQGGESGGGESEGAAGGGGGARQVAQVEGNEAGGRG